MSPEIETQVSVPHLFHGACTICLLETLLQHCAQSELSFCCMRCFAGAQKKSEYLAINPHGKVPALLIDGSELLTETASIILFLHKQFPDKSLLPKATSDIEAAQQVRLALRVIS